jgi:hypothetical protein
MERVVGKVRDFNGGMISKQHELLCNVRNLLSESANFNDVLLENFFYSLNPPIMRSVLDPNDLAKLFLLMQDTVERHDLRRDPYSIAIQRDLNAALIIIVGTNPRMKEKINQNLTHLKIPPQALATVNFHTGGTVCLGYLYRSDDPYNQDLFCQTIRDICDRILTIPTTQNLLK